MELKIKKGGIPLYIQVKELILDEIKNKKFKPGQKMPPERELAKKLNISRNTISTAYNLLERDGILISHQGKGTFVAVDEKQQAGQLKQTLLEMIDTVLDKALEAGFTTPEFQELVAERIRIKEEELKKVKAVFVECNIEQARVFAAELGEIANFTATPLSLADLLLMNGDTEDILTEARYVFTTFSHVHEVKELTAELGKDVFGVAVRPCLEGIVRIARYPAHTRFGLISISREFKAKFERNLQASGLENLDIVFTNSTDPREVARVIEETDVIVVSPGRCEEIKQLVGGKKEVIIFNTALDVSSVKAVVARLTGTKLRNKKAEKRR